MRPQDELKHLKGFIKLSEKEALKRDELEAFLENRDKVILFDADSAFHQVYHGSDWNSFYELYDNFDQKCRSIFNRIEDDGFNILHVQYFFTTCKNNFRKELYPEYKANRTKDENLIQLHTKTIGVLEYLENVVLYSNTLEADDLVSFQAKNYGKDCIIVNLDKDLNQIQGAHFSYYRDTLVIDEEGKKMKEFRGWSFTSKQEGYELFLKQLLIGDTVDNIKGVHGIGAKKADKLLEGANNFGKLRRVVEAYNDTKRLKLNIKLMKL